MSRLLAFALPLAIGVIGSATQAVTIDQAIRTGAVDVTITGRGTSSGDSISVYVRRKVPKTVRVEILPGTVFRSKSGSVQSMVFRKIRYERISGGWKKATEIVLDDDRRRQFLVEAYCRDFGKPTPKTSDTFVIDPPDTKEAKILARASEVGAGTKLVQVAIWLDRSNPNVSDLARGFNVTADELRIAKQIVASAAEVEVDVKPGAVAAPEVDAELRDLISNFYSRIQAAQANQPYRRGESVALAADAEVTAGPGVGRVLTSLKTGNKVEVVRVVRDNVLVQVKVSGRRRRGWVPLTSLNPEAKPSEQTPGIIRDAALEILNKVDINVSDN